MRLRATTLILGVAATMACSSQRKLSNVETRAPASVMAEGNSLTPIREKLSKMHKFPKLCPAQIVEALPSLVEERVKFPACSGRLIQSFTAVKAILRSEERSVVEELLGSGCRMLATDFGSSPLASLIESVVPKPARGDGEAEDGPGPLSEADMMLRMKLRDGLVEVRSVLEPLEQWMRLHGEFVMPEEELDFFDRLVNSEGCRMIDQELDQGYRALHSLEELSRIQPEMEPQRKKIERLLSGVHMVLGRKIKEYFRR